MQKLIIVTNESIFNNGQYFFCDNLDLKSTPEGLANFFDVNLIGRNSKIKRNHSIKLSNTGRYESIDQQMSAIRKINKELSSRLSDHENGMAVVRIMRGFVRHIFKKKKGC